jgi:hypothetical protein
MSDHQPDAVADLESATAAGQDAAKDAQAELEDANAAVARAQRDATYLLDEIDKIKVEQVIFIQLPVLRAPHRTVRDAHMQRNPRELGVDDLTGWPSHPCRREATAGPWLSGQVW